MTFDWPTTPVPPTGVPAAQQADTSTSTTTPLSIVPQIPVAADDPPPHSPTDDRRNGVFPNAPPPDDLRDDAIQFLASYLQRNAPDRGPFKLQKGENQQLPGISVPAWLMNILNILSGRPELPYAHDRPTLVRDLVYMGVAAYTHVLTEYVDDPEMKLATNMVRHEEQFRQAFYSQELMLSYVETLGMVAGMLQLKMAAGNRQAVYEDLQRVFHHIEQLPDRAFWRPTLLRLVFNIPEVNGALQFLNDEPMYRMRADFSAWCAIRERLEESRDVQPDMETLLTELRAEGPPDLSDIRGVG